MPLGRSNGVIYRCTPVAGAVAYARGGILFTPGIGLDDKLPVARRLGQSVLIHVEIREEGPVLIGFEVVDDTADAPLGQGQVVSLTTQRAGPANDLERHGGAGGELGEAVANTGRIADEVRGLDRIVNDVLVFAREIAPRRRPLAVEALFARVVAAHRPAIDAAGIAVQTEVDGELSIMADLELIHQALLNLLRNAVDAVSGYCGGSAATCGGEVRLAARREDGQLVLAVRDTGPGIAEEHIDRIFNPFFTTRNTGTGLGLAIVHRIVDAHGGAITVRNEGGAIFELFWPAEGEAGDADRKTIVAGHCGGAALESVGVA